MADINVRIDLSHMTEVQRLKFMESFTFYTKEQFAKGNFTVPEHVISACACAAGVEVHMYPVPASAA